MIANSLIWEKAFDPYINDRVVLEIMEKVKDEIGWSKMVEVGVTKNDHFDFDKVLSKVQPKDVFIELRM